VGFWLDSVPEGAGVNIDGISKEAPIGVVEVVTRVDGIDVERTLEAGSIYGVEWAQGETAGSPILRRINEGGLSLALNVHDFDAHPVHGGMRRCTMAPDGSINNYGANPRGDGLTLTGADGRVMVEIPKFYVKSLSPRANVYQWWISPVPKLGFEVHPAFLQRGGIERDYIYVGAFEATPILKYRDHTVNELQLDSKCALDGASAPCSQPFTGGLDATPCIAHVAFTSGSREFVVGETLTCNALDAKVVDWHLSGGTWVGGDAAGTLYIQIYNDPWAGGHWANLAITDSGVVDIATASGAEVNLALTIANCRTYSNRIGPRWGVVNPWTLSALQLLYYIEYANLNSQAAIGRGIVDKAAGIGFAGEVCGFDAANTNIAINGTGSGTGTDGLTPICYRGIENLWGNVWESIDGWNAIGDAATGRYHIIKRNGLGNLNDVDANGMLNAGNYEASLAIPTQTDNSVKNIVYEDLLRYLFVGDGAAGGSDITYLCDYLYAHNNNENNILLSGGGWITVGTAGVAYRAAGIVLSYSARNCGGRLEFV